jgi:hypothetical protein
MPSFDAINYSLRPSKSIQRQIVFDGVRLLPDVMDLDRLAYIGFGSIWFTDFVLAHKLLRIDDMVSIESNDVGYSRAKFNAPYSTVRVEHGLSTTILPKLFDDPSLAGRPWMLWLDYDYEFNESVRDDVRSVIENAPVNSILIITFNGLDRKYGQPPPERVKRLRELLGSVVPDELGPASCKAEQMQVTLADLGLDFMKSIAADIARPGGFVPAFRVLYRDGAPMVTIGGILPVRGAVRGVRDLVSGKSWPAWPSKPISAPPLTMREAAVLQSLLPCTTKLTRADVQNLGFDLEDEHIEAFEIYYRQYPAFAQIVS